MVYYVYFIQAGTDGPIKIGVTWNIAQRLRMLQYGTPNELHHIGDTRCQDSQAARKLERALHEQLKAAHMRGEWFEPTSEVRAVVPRTRFVGKEPERSTSPFALPPSKRPIDLRGEYPPWADNIDRHNLSTLNPRDRHRMVASTRKWCGSGR